MSRQCLQQCLQLPNPYLPIIQYGVQPGTLFVGKIIWSVAFTLEMHSIALSISFVIECVSYKFFFSFSSIGPVADLMSASSSYLDKNHCYNSHVYSQNYGSHCYYGNMDYLSSGVPHPSLNVPVSTILSACYLILRIKTIKQKFVLV